MTREIKFRAWDKINKEWFSGGDGFAISWDATEITDDNGITMNTSELIVLMQYTGLLDIHGKQIFEGDILRSASWGVNSKLKNPYHVVKWGAIGWKAVGYNGMMQVSPDLDVKCDWEIIGNVHQNPDLLTQ